MKDVQALAIARRLGLVQVLVDVGNFGTEGTQFNVRIGNQVLFWFLQDWKTWNKLS